MSSCNRHWQVRTQRPIAYDLIESPNLFHPDNTTLLNIGRGRHGKYFVVVDSTVHHLYGEKIAHWFSHHGLMAHIVPFTAGEDGKTLNAWTDLLRELETFAIHRRDDPILAVGGGVLTDVVGFVASSYRRGVPHIKIPTTLMGYVDASVGIKTGINFDGYKNRVGSFEPPLCVLLDRHFLASLPKRDLLNGMCEIIKLALVCDADLFLTLERVGPISIDAAFQNSEATEILERAISGMLNELQPNLFEDELSRKVDFGHTFSYGLEALYPSNLMHGEAVLLDILLSICLARGRSLLTDADLQRIFLLIAQLGIEPNIPLLNATLAWQSLQERVRHRNGKQRVPVPHGIGHCQFLESITLSELETAINSLNQWMGASHEYQ